MMARENIETRTQSLISLPKNEGTINSLVLQNLIYFPRDLNYPFIPH